MSDIHELEQILGTSLSNNAKKPQKELPSHTAFKQTFTNYYKYTFSFCITLGLLGAVRYRPRTIKQGAGVILGNGILSAVFGGIMVLPFAVGAAFINNDFYKKLRQRHL